MDTTERYYDYYRDREIIFRGRIIRDTEMQRRKCITVLRRKCNFTHRAEREAWNVTIENGNKQHIRKEYRKEHYKG